MHCEIIVIHENGLGFQHGYKVEIDEVFWDETVNVEQSSDYKCLTKENDYISVKDWIHMLEN